MKKPLFVLSLVCLVSMLVAAEVEFDATKDAKILEADPNTNYGSDYFLNVWGGTDVPSTPEEMVLVEFYGLNELTAAGMKIDSAILKFYISLHLANGHVQFYRIGDEWAEMNVTWNTRPDSNTSITVTNYLPGLQGVWLETNVTEIVRSWVEDGYPNRGFYFNVPDQGPGAQTGAQFPSRENPVNNPPKLFVGYHSSGGLEEDDNPQAALRVLPLASGKTGISFSLTSPTEVSLKVYDASGTLVATLIDGSVERGSHQIIWDVCGTGVYFVRLATPFWVLTEKAVIVR